MRANLPCLALLGVVLLPAAARAACPAEPDACTHVAFVLENDGVSGRDQNYTNGFLFAWSSRAYAPPAFLDPLAGVARQAVAEGQLRWGLSFGQKIWTPEDTAARIPDPRDRPYAAWLYGAATLLAIGEDRLSSVELQLGVVGPSALGEQVQNTTHQALRILESNGWDRQMRDEPGANLVVTRQMRGAIRLPPGDLSFGWVPTLAASLGNVQTYAAAGLMLRFGNALGADYGPPRVRPASAGTVFFEPPQGFGWYVFAGLEGRAVLHDISLDGNTWRDGPSVDREVWVGDASAGIVAMLRNARLTLTFTQRSREFAAQREPSRFGSLSLAFRF